MACGHPWWVPSALNFFIYFVICYFSQMMMLLLSWFHPSYFREMTRVTLSPCQAPMASLIQIELQQKRGTVALEEKFKGCFIMIQEHQEDVQEHLEVGRFSIHVSSPVLLNRDKTSLKFFFFFLIAVVSFTGTFPAIASPVLFLFKLKIDAWEVPP